MTIKEVQLKRIEIIRENAKITANESTDKLNILVEHINKLLALNYTVKGYQNDLDDVERWITDNTAFRIVTQYEEDYSNIIVNNVKSVLRGYCNYLNVTENGFLEIVRNEYIKTYKELVRLAKVEYYLEQNLYKFE